MRVFFLLSVAVLLSSETVLWDCVPDLMCILGGWCTESERLCLQPPGLLEPSCCYRKPKCLSGWESGIEIDKDIIRCNTANTSLEDCCATSEDYPECQSNSDCEPGHFCDNLVNSKAKISNRTGCFNSEFPFT
ncbi:unnamed protein product [Caenorhabditis bovis]|uniref:Domain of unknown function DX domain-containing protein n=1 Tax=Caenorhabditis bovis TaxID=2654633 RepID=A0A8S1F7K4_9PELO|nr:unnamed protein product [Caenorhabditis bovis]